MAEGGCVIVGEVAGTIHSVVAGRRALYHVDVL
jgi:hypothetical protein